MDATLNDRPADERRSHRRFDIQLPVRFRSDMLDFDVQADVVSGEAADIGLGGLFVRSDFLEVPGTTVHLWLSVPQAAEPVALKGRVAWIAEDPPRGPGMGIALGGSPLEQAVIDLCLMVPPPAAS